MTPNSTSNYSREAADHTTSTQNGRRNTDPPRCALNILKAILTIILPLALSLAAARVSAQNAFTQLKTDCTSAIESYISIAYDTSNRATITRQDTQYMVFAHNKVAHTCFSTGFIAATTDAANSNAEPAVYADFRDASIQLLSQYTAAENDEAEARKLAAQINQGNAPSFCEAQVIYQKAMAAKPPALIALDKTILGHTNYSPGGYEGYTCIIPPES
ncbi:hypothetical protein [Actinomyces procaprae]|uniref:hypothetical protein n=1 Tax=Actinomyces procaprae TaxID=2560010 RepID=UPI00109DC2F4|nr:hypothetical protein [Actinomyces procaprae]